MYFLPSQTIVNIKYCISKVDIVWTEIGSLRRYNSGPDPHPLEEHIIKSNLLR